MEIKLEKFSKIFYCSAFITLWFTKLGRGTGQGKRRWGRRRRKKKDLLIMINAHMTDWTSKWLEIKLKAYFPDIKKTNKQHFNPHFTDKFHIHTYTHTHITHDYIN